jgi:hypothetical protein
MPARREIKPEREQHLMNGGRCQPKEPLDISLRGWPPVHQRIGVDEREILSLPGVMSGSPHRRTRHPHRRNRGVAATGNASGARIKWKFTAQKARGKVARAYPNTNTTKES